MILLSAFLWGLTMHLLLPFVLHSYEAEFVQELLRKGERKLSQSFNYTFCYIEDVLSLKNKNFSKFLHLIYPAELVVKDTTDSLNSAYRVSVTTMANDIFRPWYCCQEYVSFIDMLTLPEHLVSPLVFIEVHVVLSFVSPYFML